MPDTDLIEMLDEEMPTYQEAKAEGERKYADAVQQFQEHLEAMRQEHRAERMAERAADRGARRRQLLAYLLSIAVFLFVDGAYRYP
jgi:hypothetical protein